MISAIVYVILILFVAAAIAALFGVRIGHTVAPAICITGLVASFMLMLNLVAAVPYVFAAIGAGCGVLAAVRVFREKKRIYNIFTTELIVFLLAAGFVIALNWGRMYTLHDEFSHWGLAVKNLFTVGRLPFSEETNSLYPGYPPLATAICYLGTCFAGGLCEGATFVPAGLLIVASFLPVITGYIRNCARHGCAKTGRFLALVPAAAMLLCILCFKLSALTIIAVDTIIGAMGFYIIWISVTTRTTADSVFAVIAAFSLALVKETGVGIVIAAAVTIFVSFIFKTRKAERTGLKRFFKNVCTLPLTVLLSGIFGALIWKFVKILANVPTEGEGMAKGIFTAVFGGLSDVQKKTVAAFFKAWTEPRFVKVLPLLAVLALFAVAGIGVCLLLRKTSPANSKVAAALLASVTACFFVYCFGLLASYWTRFSDYEANNVASFERYVGTYLTMWLGLIAAIALTSFPGPLLRHLRDKSARPATLDAVCACVSVAVAASATLLFVFAYPYKVSYSVRFRQSTAQTENLPSMIGELGGAKNANVLLISSRYDVSLRVITNYNAAPHLVESMDGWEDKLAYGQVSFIYFDDVDDKDLVEKAASLAGLDANAIEAGKVYEVTGSMTE